MTEFQAPTEVKHNAGIFVFTWPQFSIRLDHLHEAHDALSAEVMVTGTMPDASGLLLRYRYNLLSPTSGAAFSKQLAEMAPMIAWRQVATYCWNRVLDKWREGEPVRRFQDVVVNADALSYRIEPIVVEGKPNVWFGDSGTLKSMLAEYTQLLTALAETKAAGLSVEPGITLYLDYEDEETEWRERNDALLRGMMQTDASPNIYYRRMTRPLVEDIERLQAIVLDIGAEYVVVDSAGPAVGGELVDPKAVIPFFVALRTLQYQQTWGDKGLRPCTTLTIAHEPKNAEKKTAFGSGFWKFEARSMWEIRRNKEADTPAVNIGLYHHKANKGRLHKPFGLRFAFTDSSPLAIAVSAMNIEHDQELSGGMTIRDQITAALRDGAKSEDELRELLPQVEKRSLHSKLWDKQSFVRLPEGTFGIRSTD